MREFIQHYPFWSVAVAAGLGVLAKGPVGLVLPTAVIMLFLLWERRVLVVVFLLARVASAATRVQPVPVGPEMRSSAFTVTVNGKPVDVAHVAASYDYVNFDITGPVDVAITAAEPGFWDRGVDIQPWRLGLRPARQGQTIQFRLSGPAKLSISRPGDFLNYGRMLFLFAGSPPPART